MDGRVAMTSAIDPAHAVTGAPQTALSAAARAAKEASAKRKARRKQSLIEGLAVGVGGEESTQHKKDRPGRSTCKQQKESQVQSGAAMPTAEPLPEGSKARTVFEC